MVTYDDLPAPIKSRVHAFILWFCLCSNGFWLPCLFPLRPCSSKALLPNMGWKFTIVWKETLLCSILSHSSKFQAKHKRNSPSARSFIISGCRPSLFTGILLVLGGASSGSIHLQISREHDVLIYERQPCLQYAKGVSP